MKIDGSAQPLSPTRRRLLQAAGAGAMLPYLAACSDSGSDSLHFSDTIAWGRSAIQEKMEANPDVAAVSVALLWKDKIVWQEAFGQSSVKSGTAATTSTRFNIGSVSKVVAALAAMVMQDTGKFHIDEPIVRYLPGFRMLSPEFDRITSRHLLSHSSGLPGTNDRGIFTFAPYTGYAEDTEEGLQHFHLKHLPGDMNVYCNDGFTLFERVVFAVTGMRYPDFVRRHLFEPLGMVHSTYLDERLPDSTIAHPFSGGEEYGQEFCNGYATGGVCTTPADMMRLSRMFINGGTLGERRIVSPEGIALMGSDQTFAARINPTPGWKWGLGWDASQHPAFDGAGLKAWEKNGGTLFFQSEYFVLPDAGLSLLITGNSGYQPLILAEGILLRALVEAGLIQSLPEPLQAVTGAHNETHDLAAFAGVYGNNLAPMKVEFPAPGSMRIHRWIAGRWQPLDGGVETFSPVHDGWWSSGVAGMPEYGFAEVEIEENGTPVRLRYLVTRVNRGTGHYYIDMPVAQLLEPREPLSPAWRARLGSEWLFVNDIAESIQDVLDPLVMSIGEIPELPGYVLLDNEQLLIPMDDLRAGMSVKVPINNGRDLREISFPARGSSTMRIGSCLYERVDSRRVSQ